MSKGKITIIVLWLMIAFLLITIDSMAVGPLYKTSQTAQMGRKFLRGMLNIPFCIVEIPLAINKQWQSTDPFSGIFVGLGKGFAGTVKRLVSGSWDVLTFPFALPRGYRPLVKPEFPFLEE